MVFDQKIPCPKYGMWFKNRGGKFPPPGIKGLRRTRILRVENIWYREIVCGWYRKITVLGNSGSKTIRVRPMVFIFYFLKIHILKKTNWIITITSLYDHSQFLSHKAKYLRVSCCEKRSYSSQADIKWMLLIPSLYPHSSLSNIFLSLFLAMS